MLTKNGDADEAVTRPLKPLLHRHPLGTLIPKEFGGQSTALQVKVVGKAEALLEHDGVELEAGANPGMHCGKIVEPAVLAAQVPLPLLPLPLLEEAMQLPFWSANRPWAAHVRMAVSCWTMAVRLLLCAAARAA